MPQNNNLNPIYKDMIDRRKNNESTISIARHHNLSRQRIEQILAKHAPELKAELAQKAKEREIDIVSKYNDGMNIEDIASKFEMREVSIKHILKKNASNVTRIKIDKRIDQKRNDKIIALKLEGKTHTAIADTVGCHVITVNRTIKKMRPDLIKSKK